MNTCDIEEVCLALYTHVLLAAVDSYIDGSVVCVQLSVCAYRTCSCIYRILVSYAMQSVNIANLWFCLQYWCFISRTIHSPE